MLPQLAPLLLCVGTVLTIPILLPSTNNSTFKLNPFPEGRIINGPLAKQGQFPWQVALHIFLPEGTSLCGGALIHPSWILTAAHCVPSGTTGIIARFGLLSLAEHNQQVPIVRTYLHHGYEANTAANDIALLETATPVTISNDVRTIPLGRGVLKSGTKVTVSGWGRNLLNNETSSTNLKFVELTTITDSVCSRTFGNIIQSGIVCALSSPSTGNTCNGDSGGPLVVGSGQDAVHVGIVSFGSSAGCNKGLPTAYTRTEAYHDWIKLILRV